ncbi:PspC domain-containing protein [Oceanithermus sp.]
MERKRLTRSDKDRLIAGVCGWIGEFFDIDANLVRLVFLLLLFIQPSFALLYLLLALLLPRSGAEEEPLLASSARELEESIGKLEDDDRSRFWLGVGLTGLGILLLLDNLGLVWLNWSWLGALFLIGLGVYLLLKGEA